MKCVCVGENSLPLEKSVPLENKHCTSGRQQPLQTRGKRESHFHFLAVDTLDAGRRLWAAFTCLFYTEQ